MTETSNASLMTSFRPQARRRIRSSTTNTTSSRRQSSLLWTDKYLPQSIADLCVAPKKVKEIQAWMTNGTASTTPHSKLLILVGSPGIGKSTAVRLLAKEHGIHIHEWNESLSDGSGNRRPESLSSIAQESPLSSFERFLQQASVGYSSLSFSSTIHTKSTFHQNYQTSTNKRRRTNSVPASFVSPSQDCNRPVNQSPQSSKSIILVEDLPNLHGPDAELRFRNLLQSHLQHSSVPTILIWSDVVEGKHRPADFERLLLDREYLYSPFYCQMVPIHPPTKSRMKKVLQRIIQLEGLDMAKRLSDTFYEDLYVRSKGDLRSAILTLQTEQSSLRGLGTTGLAKKNQSATNKLVSDRDERLGTFHALGKLLYAKRKTSCPPDTKESLPASLQKWDDGRPPIDFDPERVLEQSDMELQGSLSFLEYHSVDFFTDISELSIALDRFSDAACLLDVALHHRQGTLFPHGYAGSLAGRAVAQANTQPTASKFRQFTAPKVFDILRKRRANQSKMEHVHHILTLSSRQYLSLHSLFGMSSQFSTDCLPLIRTILPSVVGFHVNALHSVFRDGGILSTGAEEPVDDEAIRKEQEEILQEDDIEDF